MTQDQALDILKTGCNVFLTGQAGSGKTFLLNRYIEYLRENNVGVAVTASTGIAATHMNGMTIHSWSGIGIKDELTESELRDIFRKRNVNERFRNTSVLIIDEISMLHGHRLDLVQRVARALKNNFVAPFGGMQVVLCGDFFQLPPVSREGNAADSFAFKSKSWEGMEIKVCNLETQFRQTDAEYSEILNNIRGNSVDEKTIELLHSRFDAKLSDGAITRLYTHNIDVDKINNEELNKLPGRTLRYKMRSKGRARLAEKMRKNCLAPEELILKNNAVVMFVRNNFDKGYVNGTLGTVIGFDSDTGFPIVRTKKGVDIVASPESWVLEDNGEAVAEITQLPLRLAWAITVHKSQGMSLDTAEVDLSKSFEPGMGYVALSRIRSLAGLRLLGLNEIALKVHPQVSAIDQLFNIQSRREVQKLKDMSKDNLNKKHQEFIEKTRSVTKEKNVSNEKKIKRSQEHKNAYAKWSAEDDELLATSYHSNVTVNELASIFSRKEGAIRSRLKKLGLGF